MTESSARPRHTSVGRVCARVKGVNVFTGVGISLDSWVRVEGQCAITWIVSGNEVEFRFGGQFSPGLDMILTEAALERLVAESAEALHRMRAIPFDETRGHGES